MNHNHYGAKSIDFIASCSPLNMVSPGLKFVCVIITLVMCIASKSAIVPLITLVSMSAITLFIGKIKVKIYLKLLIAPLAFIATGVVVIVFDFSKTAIGILNLPIFGNYLVITNANLQEALIVSMRAIGAISCLFALSLSTMSSEIIRVLKKLHVPSIIIELMVLIYRYIFVLLDVQHKISISTSARLGHLDFKTQMRSICLISSTLMMLSFKKSSESFDAMQARMYNGEVLFHEEKKQFKFEHLIFVAAYLASIFVSALLLGGWMHV